MKTAKANASLIELVEARRLRNLSLYHMNPLPQFKYAVQELDLLLRQFNKQEKN